MPTPSGHSTAIRAKKVLGTPVKNRVGEKVGKIEDIVLDKLSNNIMFAVVGFGGVLGAGEKYHPLPWATLDYDPNEDAYVVPYGEEVLKGAPADTINELTKNDGLAYRDRVYDYYKAERYWQ